MLIKNLLKSYFNKNYNLIVFIHNNFWSRFFIFIVIFLVILALLSIWGANFLERIINPIKFAEDAAAVVEIYPEVNEARTNSKKEIVEDYLRNNKNVINFKVVTNSELQLLLKNWTNFLSNLNNFSLPIIINVKLNPKSNYSANDLQLALSQKVSNVYVESEKALASKLASSLNVSRGLILLIPIILFFIIFIIVLFTTAGLVYAQREAIRVLSFLGASYGAVAKEFALWTFKRAIKGCIIGIIVALVLVEAFVIASNAGWFVVPSQTTLFLMLAVVVLIPLEATIIAFFWVRKVISWVV